MKSVGIRELRQRASEVLRDVARGETFEVTDRGRPVARLTPLPQTAPLQQLRDAGELTGAIGTLSDLDEPLVLPVGEETPSQVLARLRADER